MIRRALTAVILLALLAIGLTPMASAKQANEGINPCPADHPIRYYMPQNVKPGDELYNWQIPGGDYNIQAVLGPDDKHPNTVLICGNPWPPPAKPVTGNPNYTG